MRNLWYRNTQLLNNNRFDSASARVPCVCWWRQRTNDLLMVDKVSFQIYDFSWILNRYVQMDSQKKRELWTLQRFKWLQLTFQNEKLASTTYGYLPLFSWNCVHRVHPLKPRSSSTARTASAAVKTTIIIIIITTVAFTRRKFHSQVLAVEDSSGLQSGQGG